MAGHSKWANIKRKKGAVDAARGKLFTKLIKEITVAAKLGGPDPDANPRLRLAVDKAKGQSMPKATIERAIAKAAGDLTSDSYENLTYEGYGPGGVAILVECLTDNRNRTASEVKHAFAKEGGNLGTAGSVAYLFRQVAEFALPAEGLDEETVLLAALEGGGHDVRREDDEWVVVAPFEAYDRCRRALDELGVEPSRSEIVQVPDSTIELGADDARALVKLLERLDDLDDVQDTWTNAEFDEELVAGELA